MEPRIADLAFHAGAPAISRLSRTPGYRITGKGFGQKRGKVEITDETGELQTQRSKSWSDDLIEIDRPMPDPLGWGTWDIQVIVTTADGRRSARFDVVRPGNLYDYYVRPQDRPGEALRRAA